MKRPSVCRCRVVRPRAVLSVVTAGQATQPPAPEQASSIAGTAKTPGNIWLPAKKAAPTSPALSPEEEMKTFSLPPGYHAQLVAAEPLIESPIIIDFDPDGRMWVLELQAFLPDTSGRDTQDPDLRCRRSRGHERRRHDGQADGICRSARAAARAQGSRSRRARRRTAKPLADEGHRRRSSRPTRRKSSTRTTGDSSAASSTTPTACSGRWTTSCTRRSGTKTCD